MRRFLFCLIFSENERIAIAQALWRRTKDLSTENAPGDLELRKTCERIIKQLMTFK
jgi:hypothetical protein